MRHSLFLSVCLLAGSLFTATAQQAVDLGQTSLSKWKIGTANYSGIAPMGNGRYAVVSDKEPADGFFVFRIDQKAATGEVASVYLEGFYGNSGPRTDSQGHSVRDCEGVAYFPPARTVFISGEGDQKILEYDLKGQPTGRELNVPAIFRQGNIVANYGFEALSYSPENHRFWTTTESTLPADGHAAGPLHPSAQNLLRLQSFDDHLQPVAQIPYRMDRGKSEDFGKIYAFGVPALTALPDGRLLVLEREADVSNGYMSSEVVCKLFVINPAESWQIDAATDIRRIDSNRFPVKTLLARWVTKLTPFNYSFANYEGMCLGRTLSDGRQTLLLISDSQGGFSAGPISLKDYIRVLILP